MYSKLLATAIHMREQIEALRRAQGNTLGTTTNDIQVSQHFNLNEFQCKGANCCGNSVKLHPELVRRLQSIRDELGSWVIITSGYRCPVHNQREGGSSNSQHLYGTAADLRAANMPRLTKIAEKHFPDGGFSANYSDHIHVDVRSGRARW